MGGLSKGLHLAQNKTRFLVVFVLVILALSFIPFSTTIGDSRATRGAHDVNVYFHSGGIMNTIAPSTSIADIDNMNNGDTLTFDLERALGGDLAVQGKDMVGVGKGFWMYLGITIPSNASVSIQIFDGASKLAETTLSSSVTSTDQISVPFMEASKTNHTFNSGSIIRVRLEAATSTIGIIITFDSSAFAGHLVLTCDQMKFPTDPLAIKDSQGMDNTVFTPNHPDQIKLIKFEGSVDDILGAQDVSMVLLQAWDSNDQLIHENQTAITIPDTNGTTVEFKYDWEYPEGLDAGEYTAQAVVQDQSGNNFTTSAKFEFAAYGVYLYTTQKDRNGAIGSTVDFPIRVYNTGGSEDTIDMSSVHAETWTVELDDTSITLAPGLYQDINVTVHVPGSAMPQDSYTLDLKGTSQADNSYDQITLTATAVSSFDFKFEVQGDPSATISPGASKDFTIQLQNTGEQSDTYNFYIKDAPPDSWLATMSATGATEQNTTGRYQDFTIDLGAGESIQIHVLVSVDVDPTVPSTNIDVTAQSDNDPFATQYSVTLIASTEIDWKTYVRFEGDADKKTAGIANSALQAYDPVAFTISITNIETRSITVHLSVEITGEWSPSILPNSPTLEGGATKLVTITFYPPDKTQSGTHSFSVIILEQDALNPTLDINLNGKIVIPAIHKFVWEISKKNKTIDEKEGEVDFTIKVYNRGNVFQETVEILIEEVGKSKGFEVTPEEDFSSVSIKRNDNRTLHVTVKALDNAPSSGEYKFRLKVNSTLYDASSDDMIVKTDIDPPYLTFFLGYFWVPIALLIVIGAALFLRYKQLT